VPIRLAVWAIHKARNALLRKGAQVAVVLAAVMPAQPQHVDVSLPILD
jgi:hypothetical protein